MKKLCSYYVAEAPSSKITCKRQCCHFVHEKLNWIWEHYKDEITEENSRDCHTGKSMSEILPSMPKQVAPKKKIEKKSRWLDIPDFSDSESESTASEGDESPPPAMDCSKEKGIKDILKENGYSILNGDAYSRESKPHCHVIFDSEKNTIEKAFFTFDPETKF